MKTIDQRRKYTKDLRFMFGLLIGIFFMGLYGQIRLADAKNEMLYPTYDELGNNYAVWTKEVEKEVFRQPENNVEIIKQVFGKDADQAIAVARCESGLRSNAINKANKNGSKDMGLFQINSVHGIPERYLLNPVINAQVAKQMFDANGWNNWRSSNKCHGLLAN